MPRFSIHRRVPSTDVLNKYLLNETLTVPLMDFLKNILMTGSFHFKTLKYKRLIASPTKEIVVKKQLAK